MEYYLWRISDNYSITYSLYEKKQQKQPPAKLIGLCIIDYYLEFFLEYLPIFQGEGN